MENGNSQRPSSNSWPDMLTGSFVDELIGGKTLVILIIGRYQPSRSVYDNDKNHLLITRIHFMSSLCQSKSAQDMTARIFCNRWQRGWCTEIIRSVTICNPRNSPNKSRQGPWSIMNRVVWGCCNLNSKTIEMNDENNSINQGSQGLQDSRDS